MVQRLFVWFLLLTMAGGCGSASLKLMSQVVDEDNKANPVEGARVQVLDQTGTVIAETTSGKDGSFEIEIPKIDKSKSYEMVVQKELVSEVARKPLNVDAKNPVPAQVALPVRGAQMDALRPKARHRQQRIGNRGSWLLELPTVSMISTSR